MHEDPHADPATGVLRNKLGLDTAATLETAEREITHSAMILLRESPVRATYNLAHLSAIHRRIFGDIYDWAGQGYVLNWQDLDAERNITVSDAIMRGDPGPMRKMLDEPVRDQ